MTDDLYREDLANIHIDGYGFHWQGAAPAILSWLREYDVHGGLVVDLGCGGGQWLACLADEGFHVCGVDISPSMIRAAKKLAPKSKFLCGSFADTPLPNCDAMTSLGEPLNYLNSGPAMQRTMRNVFSVLRPGGVFIFDVRHPPETPVAPIHHNLSAKDWFCYARIEEDHRTGSLIRHITTFRRVGQSKKFRRNEETHRLKLFSKSMVSGWLRKIGFRVKTRRSYADYKLGKRQSVFVCRKPS